MDGAMSCIYCPSTGPYTEEHVISAGLGGDDKDWLLKDCVCSNCNTKIFSPLEQKVLRSSPVALARLFLQPKTRDRGNKTAPPTIQPALSYYHDPASGLLLEQELKSGGEPSILPQAIIAPPERFLVFAADVDAAKMLRKELTDAFDGSISIIEKGRDGFEVKYSTTPLTWNTMDYEIGTPASAAKPPKSGGVWFEDLATPATNQAGLLLPRVYKRSTGQLNCRARDVRQAAALLTHLRLNIDQFAIPDQLAASTNPTPDIHLRLRDDQSAHDRVLAKTGINLCAHLFGADFARRPEFARVRDYARTGNGVILMLRGERAEAFTKNLSATVLPIVKDHHIFVLLTGPGQGQKGQGLVFLSRLYSGPIEGIRLAEFDTVPPELNVPVFVVVDYVNQKILRMSQLEYAVFLNSHGIVA